jgi:hypothetical protein
MAVITNGIRNALNKAQAWRLYERGISSITIFILGFPMLILAFGFGIDLMRVGQAKRVAQGRLDVAVQSAASMTYTTTAGAVRIGVPGDGTSGQTALETARTLYRVNTAPYRQVGASNGNLFSCAAPVSGPPATNIPLDSCSNRGGPTLIIPSTGIPDPTYNFCTPASQGGYGVRYAVVEQVPTIFMRMVPGAPRFFNIQVESQALLRQQFC